MYSYSTSILKSYFIIYEYFNSIMVSVSFLFSVTVKINSNSKIHNKKINIYIYIYTSVNTGAIAPVCIF